jgi:polycystin 1L2
MVMIVYFMWLEIQLLYELKWKYLHQFWSFLEIGIIVCSWSSVGIYVWRYKECKRIGTLFAETNGYVYINLQLASYVNDVLTFFYGFCCFFGTIKFIHLCRFNRRLYLFVETLKYAGKELVIFSMMFSILFMSFVYLFYFLFISKLSSCSSLLKTSQMLFEMMLMKFDAHELTGAAAFLGPFCFSLFIFLVAFVCLSLFLSIINRSFRRARENIKNDKQDISTFMLKKFQRWTGLKKASKEELQEERDAAMRSEYFDPIERWPEKIDQLLGVIDRVCLTFIRLYVYSVLIF